MITFNNLLSEIQKIPSERFEELYSVLKSFNISEKTSKHNPDKILKYAGLFSSMTDKDYNDFEKKIDETREGLFDRTITV